MMPIIEPQFNKLFSEFLKQNIMFCNTFLINKFQTKYRRVYPPLFDRLIQVISNGSLAGEGGGTLAC